MRARTRLQKAVPPERSTADFVHVARQPIVDCRLGVAAYALHYPPESRSPAPAGCPTHDALQTLLAATLDIGLRHLVGDFPAHMRIPPDLLPSLESLPVNPERVVIDLRGSDPAQGDLAVQIASLRRRGFRFVVEHADALRGDLPRNYADFATVDIQRCSGQELEPVVRQLQSMNLSVIATRVESVEQLETCRRLGFNLLQGTFLEKPQVIGAPRVHSAHLTVLDLIQKLNDPRQSPAQIEASISRDVGLSYRMLRSINSSYFYMPRQISSIREATVLLGYGELHKLCWLLLLAGLEGQPHAVALQALTRARMCESLCIAADLRDADTYFMTGMLSLLGTFLQQPQEQALCELPLRRPVLSALLWNEGDLGSALACVIQYERANWSEVGFASLDQEQIAAAYLHAIGWAENVWKQFQPG
jgi:c-di-GMP phosphodiesterase